MTSLHIRPGWQKHHEAHRSTASMRCPWWPVVKTDGSGRFCILNVFHVPLAILVRKATVTVTLLSTNSPGSWYYLHRSHSRRNERVSVCAITHNAFGIVRFPMDPELHRCLQTLKVPFCFVCFNFTSKVYQYTAKLCTIFAALTLLCTWKSYNTKRNLSNHKSRWENTV